MFDQFLSKPVVVIQTADAGTVTLIEDDAEGVLASLAKWRLMRDDGIGSDEAEMKIREMMRAKD